MVKKSSPDKTPPEKIDIIIESDQWESAEPARFTWRHGLIISLIISLILAGAILFVLGFLVIAGVVVIAAIVINIILFILRKLA